MADAAGDSISGETDSVRSNVVNYAPEHRAGVLDLWQRHFGAWVTDRLVRHWDWRFTHNPFVDSREPSLFVALSEQTGQVVGAVASNPVPLRFAHRPITALCGGGLAIDEPYRGRCLDLSRRLIRNSPAIAGGLHPSVRAIIQHLGFSFVPGSQRRFTLWLRHDGSRARQLRKHLRRSVIRLATPRLVSILPDNFFGRDLPPTTALPSSANGADIRPFDRFDATYDALWTRASSDIPCTIERSSTYMNWRHVDCPTQSSIRLALYENGNLRAIAVGANRVEHDWTGEPCVVHGELTEIIADDPRSPGVRALLVELIRQLDRRRCDSISALGLRPAYHPLLHDLGFTDQMSDEFAMAVNPTHEPRRALDLMGENDWYTSAADADALYAATI